MDKALEYAKDIREFIRSLFPDQLGDMAENNIEQKPTEKP